MKIPTSTPGSQILSIGGVLLIVTFAASGQDKPAMAAGGPVVTHVKPAWLTELSLGIREGYDNNVFLSDVPGAIRQRESWITTVSPKIAFNVLPALGEQTIVKTFSFSYAPDFVSYHNEQTESFNAHRISTTLKGKAGAFSFSLDNAFVYIDGDKTAPIYANGLNAYATAMPRERREQFQDRANINLQFDQEKWFVRLASSLLYYELLTDQSTAIGYQNYPDRYDVNGGVDFGYKINPQLSATLGYRYGRQYQEQVIGTMLSASSDYQRVLVGFEGKPWQWLTVAIVGGPDFRSYDDTAPVSDANPVRHYGEASLTAQVTSKDTLAFKYKQFQWVSSTGKVAYFDNLYSLSYNRKVTTRLLTDISGRIMSADYTGGLTDIGGPTNTRDDWMYTVSAGLVYSFTPNISATLTYSVDFGRNNQDGLSSLEIERRTFERHMAGVGATIKF